MPKIQGTLVDTLSKKKTPRKLTTFLQTSLQAGSHLTFDTHQTYCAFAKLVVEKIERSSPLYKNALIHFRKMHGLPNDLFFENVTLVGLDKSEYKVSKELLISMLDRYKDVFAPGLQESTPNNGDPKFQVPLSKEALEALKGYLLNGKIGDLSFEALTELEDFAKMPPDKALMQEVERAFLAHFCETKNEAHWRQEYLANLAEKFARMYLKKHHVSYRVMDNNQLTISLYDFIQIFQHKESKICQLLAQEIGGLIPDSCDYSLLEIIPLKFRRAICGFSVEDNAPTPDLLKKYDFIRNLACYFPNVLIGQSKMLEAAISHNHNDSFAHAHLGNILRLQGKLPEAETHLLRALKLNSKYFFALARMGDVLRQQGKLPQTENHFLKTLELEPSNSFALARMGEILWQQGKLPQAETHFLKALEINPKYPTALACMGDVLRQQGKLPQAEEYLLKAIKLNSKHYFALARMGDVLRQQGKLPQAEEHLLKALELEPSDSFALARIGDVLRQQGKLSEIETHLLYVLELEPKNSLALVAFGDILRKQNKLVEAETNLLKAIQHDPKNCFAHVFLSRLLTQLDKHEEAENTANQALLILLHKLEEIQLEKLLETRLVRTNNLEKEIHLELTCDGSCILLKEFLKIVMVYKKSLGSP